jgi:PGF-CTERM protein
VRTEYALLGVALLAVLAAAGVAVGVSDALDPSASAPEERTPPARISLVELAISPGAVGGENATLEVTPALQHRGGDAEDVRIVLRAVDRDTGFVTATDELAFGTLESDGETRLTGSLTVERQGDYDVQAVVYVNGTRTRVGSREVSGVGSLTPAYRDTPLEFQSFDAGMPVIEYRIRDVTDNQTTLDVSTYLTNTGSRSVGGLELVLTARQNGSNVVADRTTIQIDDVGSGKTATPSGELVVPDDYNYYLDAVLWRDGTVVATARSTANLAPGTGLTVDEDAADGGDGFQAGDFEQDEGDGPPGEEPPDEPTDVESGGQPGFGLAAALVALLAAVAAVRFGRQKS